MFQIDEDEFSFEDDEEFWSGALELEASAATSNSGGPSSNCRISKGSLATGNQLQQNQAGSLPVKDAPNPAIQTFGGSVAHTVDGLKESKLTRTLQDPHEDLPVIPGYQAKRKFSFKQKSPRSSPGGLSAVINPGQDHNKRLKQDGLISTAMANSHLQVGNGKPKTVQDVGRDAQISADVIKRNLRVPTNTFPESAKVNGSNNVGSLRPAEMGNRAALQKLSQVTSGSIISKTSESFLQKNLSLPARCDRSIITPGHPPGQPPGQPPGVVQSNQSKAVEGLPFETESNFEDELNLPDDYFNWDPVVTPSTDPAEHSGGLRSSHSTVKSDVAITPRSTSQSSLNQQSSSAVQSTTSLASGQRSDSSMVATRPNTSTSRFSTSNGNQNLSANFTLPKTSQQMQGNLARTNFHPQLSSSPSYSIPRPGTQHTPRSNTSPLLSHGSRIMSQGTSTPRIPNTIHPSPRQFPAPTQSLNSSSIHQRMTSSHQGDKPFTTHGAKPQNRGTPTPQTPLLTSRVAQLFQTPPTGSSGSLRTRVRKFPGPAGVLPKLGEGQKLSDLTVPLPESDVDIPSRSALKEEKLPCSQDVGDTDFIHGAWQTMKADLDLEDDDLNSILVKNNIASVLRKASLKQLAKNKVPHLSVLIKTITFSPDASVVLRDPTGEMQGTIHKRLVDEHQADLKPGAVLVLKQVGVLSPSQRNHYLNITLSNLIQIYPSESLTSSQSSPKTPKSRTPGRPPRRPSGDCTLPINKNQSMPKTLRPQDVKQRSDSVGCESQNEGLSGERISWCLGESGNSGLAPASVSSIVNKKEMRSNLNQIPATRLEVGQNERASICSNKRISTKPGRSLSDVTGMQSSVNIGVSCKSTPLKSTKGSNGAALKEQICALPALKMKDSNILTTNSGSRGEDFTELLADIGDDFFEDF